MTVDTATAAPSTVTMSSSNNVFEKPRGAPLAIQDTEEQLAVAIEEIEKQKRWSNEVAQAGYPSPPSSAALGEPRPSTTNQPQHQPQQEQKITNGSASAGPPSNMITPTTPTPAKILALSSSFTNSASPSSYTPSTSASSSAVNTPSTSNFPPMYIESSLTSNRPAPPSPAVSRRASQVPSTASSEGRSHSSHSHSRRNSRRTSSGLALGMITTGNISRNGSTKRSGSKRLSTASGASVGSTGSPKTPASVGSFQQQPPTPMSPMTQPPLSATTPTPTPTPLPSAATPTPTQSQSQQPQHSRPLSQSQTSSNSTAVIPNLLQSPKVRLFSIKIRDFAFVLSDDKHHGLGADVPRANRPKRLLRTLNKHLRTSVMSTDSTRSSVDDGDREEDDDDDDDVGGLGKFRFGFGRLSWSFGNRNNGTTDNNKANNIVSSPSAAGFPSHSDLQRNFADDGGEDDDEEEEEQFFDDESPQYPPEYAEAEPPLVPGLYRALYPFVPEGTAEMALEEDQHVKVVGRGGGVGWAVVVAEEGGADGEGRRHALVPESYLELVRADLEEYEEEVEEQENGDVVAVVEEVAEPDTK